MFDPIVLASSTATWAINKLLDRLYNAAIKALLKQQDLDQEVAKLKHALQRANLVLGAVPVGVAAGFKIENKNLEEPIQEVQQLATELTKYLDELEYYDIKEKVKKNIPKKSWSKITSEVKNVVGLSNQKINKSDIPHIRNIVEKLHGICGNIYEALHADKKHAGSSTDTREAAPYSTQTKVFSRDRVKTKILEVFSTRASSDQVSIIPIVGDGGVGKTTLAQYVYNDPEVKKKFDIRIWIYVSSNFDEVKLTQKILEQIPEYGHKNSKSSLAALQHDMNQFLSKSRFLLVLDDMWEDSEGRWDKLLAPVRDTEAKGNVILVTTRSSSVAKITTKTEADHIKLDGLDEQDFFPFFKKCIFDKEDLEGHEMLLNIAEDIASKLNRNPLAAKSVGSLLRRNKNDVEYWRRILDSDEWRFQERKDDIIPALKLSYNHLPCDLQLLFSYCAIFPKGHEFDKDELIRIWIALGFVVHERKKLEDHGSDCFDDLVNWSFFHKQDKYFVVHDLMHDVAQEVMIKKCLIIDHTDHLRDVFPSVCHLGIWTELAHDEQSSEGNDEFEEKLDAFLKDKAVQQDDSILGSLESLILVGVYDENFSAKLVTIFERLRYVRVLRLQLDGIWLSSVEKFKHLRYLELRNSDGQKPLPEHICKLYHLQILDVRYWSGLNDLPEGMSNLVNLRYLLVPEPGSLHSKISNVGDLEFLQELKQFRVQKNTKGFDISQLGNLKEIKGSLSILDLENVTDKQKATDARIRHKKYLRTLELSWGSRSTEGANPALQENIVECLKPHKNLSNLSIVNYAGTIPSWLAKNLSLTNLESLNLKNCAAVNILPPFQLMRFLGTLSLVGLSALNEIEISKCSALNEIEISKCSTLKSIKLHACKALTMLSIEDCGALTSLELEDFPSDQVELKVQGCPQL